MSKQWRLRRSIKAAAVLTLALIGGGLMAPTAQASEDAVQDDGLESCGVFIETGQSICVTKGADLHAEILRVTGTRIVDSTGKGAPKPSESSAEQRASFLVVRLWDDANYQSRSWDYFSTTQCSSGVVKNSYSDLFIGGNDRVSSFQGFSNCKIELYENINFGGAVVPYASARSSITGVMNDKTSSFRAKG